MLSPDGSMGEKNMKTIFTVRIDIKELSVGKLEGSGKSY